MDQYIWYLIRATGMVAYVLMFFSVLTGLYSQYAKSRKIKIKNTLFLHEKLSDWSLILVVIHVVALFFDRYVTLNWIEILVPLQTNYHPLGMATGIFALYFLIFTMVTSKAKKLIGYKVWKKLHGLNPILYILTTVHGIFLGSDTNTAFYVGINAVPMVILLALLFKKTPAQTVN